MKQKEFIRECLHLIDNWVGFQTYIHEIPGVSLGLFVQDEILLQKQYGYANLKKKVKLTKDHLFRIASHSKLFTATAIMKLYHQEKLSLDDKVVKYLPWFRSTSEPERDLIRIRHLLSHASGITRDGETGHWGNFEFPDLEKLKEEIAKPLVYYETNQHLKYSNYAYTLLGQIVAKVSETDYGNYIKTQILDPLGMDQTLVDIDDTNYTQHATGYRRKFPESGREEFHHVPAKIMSSATGLSSTVEDLIKFYQAHLFGNESLFPDYIKREMQTVKFLSDKSPAQYGLGFSISELAEYKILGHGGGYPGFITRSGMVQNEKIILVIFTNSVDGPAFNLFVGILGVLSKLIKSKEKFNNGESKDFSSFVGLYMSDWGPRLYSQIGQKLVSINPELIDPTEQLQIYEHVGGKEFISPPDLPFAIPGQPVEFLSKEDGRFVVKFSGVEIEPYDIPIQ